MESIEITKIKSSYIIKNIFNFIKDKNFKVKLFLYTKNKDLHNNLEIDFNDLKEKYLRKIGFYFNEYFHKTPKSFSKILLNEKYNNFFNKKNYTKEKIENIIYDIFKNKEIKDIDEEILIDIDSPLFKVISKIKIFEKQFSIFLDEYKLKDENIIEFFNDLNKSNINYSSIFFNLDDCNKINNLKELNIDFNKIKRFTINIEHIEFDKYLKKKYNKYFSILYFQLIILRII